MSLQGKARSRAAGSGRWAPIRLHNRSFLSAAFAGLLAAGALVALASRARADVPNPVRIAVIFEQAGKPCSGPVRFTITCYGHSYTPGPDPELAPGSYTPEPVYTLAGDCAGAGCTVDEDLYLNYRHLDRCDLNGDASGVRFQVKNYAQTPIDFSTCGSPAGSDYRRPCELRVALPEDVALPAAPQGSASAGGRSYAVNFLLALLLTLLIELPILWVLARGVFKLTAVPARRLLGVGVLGSLLTLPILWFVLPAWFTPGIAIILGEALAAGVEALLYWRLLVALVLSVAANLASFGVGLLVF